MVQMGMMYEFYFLNIIVLEEENLKSYMVFCTLFPFWFRCVVYFHLFLSLWPLFKLTNIISGIYGKVPQGICKCKFLCCVNYYCCFALPASILLQIFYVLGNYTLYIWVRLRFWFEITNWQFIFLEIEGIFE